MQRPLPAASAPVTVRAARETDVDRLLEIHLGAFPDPRPVGVRRRVFLHNRLGGLEHLRVAERGGDLVAHAFSFPVSVWFGGREVRGGAIASVGVAVEARGDGVAGSLLAALHAESAARGDAFTLLYPFRHGFYARLGYAPLARQRVLTLSPRAIPRAWRASAPGKVRRADGNDRAAIARLYREVACQGTGFLVRPERAWDYDFLDERRQWLVLDEGTGAGAALTGYLSFRLHQSEGHARVRAEVYEVVSPDAATLRRLYAALGALGDQVTELTVSLADDDPLDWALLDADRDRPGTEEVEHATGLVSTGPMIRLHGAREALLARGYAVDGSALLEVDGEAPFRLEVRDGVARVTGVDAGVPAALTMSRATLASVAFGGLRLDDAERLGLLGAPPPHAGGRPLSRRDSAALLHIPPFFTLDAF
jgi:predicted acetyltransferase